MIVPKKTIATSTVHKVDKKYFNFLKKQCKNEVTLEVISFHNRILEVCVFDDDKGERFFQDHVVLANVADESEAPIDPDFSYRIYGCNFGSEMVKLIDDTFIHATHLDLTTVPDANTSVVNVAVTPTWRMSVHTNVLASVTDKRGVVWEMFSDSSYFDMIAVKPQHETNFNSMSVFHFNDKEDAEKFLTLLEKST